MAAREDVTALLDIVLQTAVTALGVKFEYIPLEYEQVVFNALLKAYEMGEANAHAKPTIPSRSSQNLSAVRPSGYPFMDEKTPAGFKRTKRPHER